MRIAITSDFHLGLKRFYEDSFKNAEIALKKCEELGDIIVIAGDIFDNKNPSLETIKKAIEMFKKIKKPILIIRGNHDKPIKGSIGPLDILALLENVYYLHNSIYEKNGYTFYGIGYVPEEYAKLIIKKIPKKENLILIMHQGIKGLVGDAELEIGELKNLSVELIINGHIHKKQRFGKLLIVGSTIATQLKKEEMGEKGIFIYNTDTKELKFYEIEGRKFIYKEVVIEEENIEKINEKIKKIVKETKKENEVIKIKIKGKLKEGIKKEDLMLEKYEDVFIDTEIEDIKNIVEKIKIENEEKKSIREIAIEQLIKNLKGKVSFNVRDVFEKAKEGKLKVEDFE